MSEKSILAAMTTLAGAAAIVVFAVDPARSGLYPPCVFHALTGLSCPGCGSARAVHELLHGHVMAALRFNPAAVLFLPVLGAAWMARAIRVATGRPHRPVAISNVWVLVILASIIVYWIARNIPAYPFGLLAP
jgi:hypothetical protein